MQRVNDKDNFIATLSNERFTRYQDWAQGCDKRAICLYTLNSQISEALYIPLQMFEIALRNRIDSVLTEKYGDDWMFENEQLLSHHQKMKRNQALLELEYEKKEASKGGLVAKVSFGFWTGFLQRRNDKLWRSQLHKIAIDENGSFLKLRDLASRATKIRKLRNRVAHHEPVIGTDLKKQHAEIIQMTSWLSPSAAEWSRGTCRFTSLYPKDGLRECRIKSSRKRA